MNRYEEPSSEYRCMGDLHVHRATYLIAVGSVGIWLGVLIGYLYGEDRISAALAFLGLLASLFLYCGNRRESAFMYTPFLAYNIVDSLYNMGINSMLLFNAFVYLKLKSPSNYIGIKSPGAAFGVLFASSVIVAICLVRLYFAFVVHRGYLYLKSKPALQSETNHDDV